MRQQIVLEQEDLRQLKAGEPLAMTFADGRVVTIILESGTERAERSNGDPAKKKVEGRSRRKTSATEAELTQHRELGGLRCPEVACGQVLKGTKLNDAKGSLRRHRRTAHGHVAAGPSGVGEAHES